MSAGGSLGGQLPVTSGITGTTRVATGGPLSQYTPAIGYNAGTLADNTGVGYDVTINSAGNTAGTSMMGPAIQTIWSKEILFQSMPVLRFEQFAVKKTELGTMPGLTVNFMRYNNLPIPAGPLLEGVRMRTHAITANQYAITVAEQGFAVAVSELLLNASFDDIMASSSRLLGRNMAMYMDGQARATLQRSSSVVFGYSKPTAINTGYGIYEGGTPAANLAALTSSTQYYLTPYAIKDAVEVLASKNVPRMGETYICFIHPHQSRRLRDTPEWIEVTKYAAPGNFMLGEIGRLDDVVFIETTQIAAPYGTDITGGSPVANKKYQGLPGGQLTTQNPYKVEWRPGPLTDVLSASNQPAAGPTDVPPYNSASADDVDTVPVPAWGDPWGPSGGIYEAIMLGDNAFGHAVSLPVELRDGGVLDFGREHALAWYSIWGWGVVTDSAVVKIETN